MPALPYDEAGKYVAAAYTVFVALILLYVLIMVARISRIEQDLAELADVVDAQPNARTEDPTPDKVTS